MTKRVIEIICISTEWQAPEDRAGIPAQRAINRRTADIYNLQIVKTIELVNVSSTAVLRPPEILNLLKLIESLHIHAAVARGFLRVEGPDSFGDGTLFQVLRDTGTVLYLPDGPLDLNSETGALPFAVQHYTVNQVAKMWNLSHDSVLRIFEKEPDVLVLSGRLKGSRRNYRTMRLPAYVVERVHRRLSGS